MKPLFLIIFFLLASCQMTTSSDSLDPKLSANLVGTTWEVTLLNTQPLLSNSTITLQIEANRVSGNASCNMYFTEGDITFAEGEINIKEFGRTTRGCVEALNEQESMYLQTFAAAKSYQLVKEQLQILDNSGNIIIELIPITQ